MLRDKILGLLFGFEILGDPFPGFGFGRWNLNAPAFSMFVVAWCHVPVLPQLTSKTSPKWPTWADLSEVYNP